MRAVIQTARGRSSRAEHHPFVGAQIYGRLLQAPRTDVIHGRLQRMEERWD